MHGPGHNMKLCKVMQSQAKYMKLNWLTACGGRAGCVRFHHTKKRPSEEKDLNGLVTNAIKEFMKPNICVKYKAEYDSISEE